MNKPATTPPSDSKHFIDATNEVEASLLYLAVETAELPLLMYAVASPEKNLIRFYTDTHADLNKVKNTYDHLLQLLKVNQNFKTHLQPLIEYNKMSFATMTAYAMN